MKIIKDQKGAASVLVILLIVVLATFGAVAIMAGWTQQSLSERVVYRTERYYALDAQAERILADMDACLWRAQQRAGKYISEQYPQGVIPEGMSCQLPTSFVRETKREPGNLAMRALMVEDIYTRVYYYYATQELRSLCDEIRAELHVSSRYTVLIDLLDVTLPKPNAKDLALSFEIADSDSNLLLEVSLGVGCDRFAVDFSDDEDWRSGITMIPQCQSGRVDVLMWKQSRQHSSGIQSATYDGEVENG